jgi:Isochorismatase family
LRIGTGHKAALPIRILTQLKQRGIQKIIFVSMIANTCVEVTARLGLELGYHVTLIKDATAACSDEGMNAALRMKSMDRHLQTLFLPSRICWLVASKWGIKITNRRVNDKNIASQVRWRQLQRMVSRCLPALNTGHIFADFGFRFRSNIGWVLYSQIKEIL